MTKKIAKNNGEVAQYLVEDSHPAIIDTDIWEAVQLEMKRRKAFAEANGISKVDYASVDNSFAGRVICVHCNSIFGRKVWNSNDEMRRRLIWRCNKKYAVKGKKSCESGHIADKVLYQVFINVFNTLVENRDYFTDKWNKLIEEEDILRRVVARRFIDIIKSSQPIKRFDVDLYFKMVEKMTVADEDKIVVTLLDGSDVEVVIE